MPRLKNINHEKIAREYVKELSDKGRATNGEIYSKVYRNASLDSARAQGSVLINKPEVQQRIQEIIAEKNSPREISQDLAELRQAKKEVFDPEGNLIEVKDNQTRLGAVQTVLKTMNAFNEQEHKQINNYTQNVINIGFLSSLSSAMERLAGLNHQLEEQPNQ